MRSRPQNFSWPEFPRLSWEFILARYCYPDQWNFSLHSFPSAKQASSGRCISKDWMWCRICAEKSVLDLCVIWTPPWLPRCTFKPLCYVVLFCAVPQTPANTIDYTISLMLSHPDVHSISIFLSFDYTFLKFGSIFFPQGHSLAKFIYRWAEERRKAAQQCCSCSPTRPWDDYSDSRALSLFVSALSENRCPQISLFSFHGLFSPHKPWKKIFCLHRDDIVSPDPKASLPNLQMFLNVFTCAVPQFQLQCQCTGAQSTGSKTGTVRSCVTNDKVSKLFTLHQDEL